jgi:hypothetical protein
MCCAPPARFDPDPDPDFDLDAEDAAMIWRTFFAEVSGFALRATRWQAKSLPAYLSEVDIRFAAARTHEVGCADGFGPGLCWGYGALGGMGLP